MKFRSNDKKTSPEVSKLDQEVKTKLKDENFTNRGNTNTRTSCKVQNLVSLYISIVWVLFITY